MLLRQGAQQLLSNIQKVIMMKSEIRIRNSAEICHVDIEGDIGVPEEWQFAALMAENNGAGRWLSPEEAVAAGLADRVIGAEAPEPDAGGDAAAAGGDAETEELYGFDDGAEESSAERPSAGGASDAAPGTLARWVRRAVRGWRERLSGGRGGMRRETAEELSGREPAAAAQSGGTASDALRRGDDARPLPADAAVVQRRSVLALREAQLQVGPTRVRPTEDPSCRERLRTANERAYAEDARSFAKN